MKSDTGLIRNSFICGMSLYCLIIIGSYFQVVTLIVIAGTFLPGLAFGEVVGYYKNTGLKSRLTIFTISSSILYFVCFRISQIAIQPNQSFLMMLIASISGSILLYVFYFFLIRKNKKFLLGLIYMIAVGFIGALPSTLTLLFFSDGDPENNFHSQLLLFSIFPAWQTLFAVALTQINTYNAIT